MKFVPGYMIIRFLRFHVSFKTNKYSVPYQYVGKKVDIKVNSNSLEIFMNIQE